VVEDDNRDRAQPTRPPDREDFGDLEGILLIDPDEADIGDDGGLASPQLADLSLTKIVDNPRPQIGEVVSFTITIHNRGPDNATNVVVSEPLTSGLRLTLASPTHGIFNQAGGLWTISAISAGQSATLTLVTKVIGSETMTNTVQVSGVDQFDPDSKPGNSLEQEDDQDTVQIEVASELASIKISDTGPAPQPDDPTTTTETPSSPTTIPESILGIFGSLNWMYALIVGLLVIVIGLILTNRSK
jgi:uncharacterized repeat protein (TIGR01451 family)